MFTPVVLFGALCILLVLVRLAFVIGTDRHLHGPLSPR